MIMIFTDVNKNKLINLLGYIYITNLQLIHAELFRTIKVKHACIIGDC